MAKKRQTVEQWVEMVVAESIDGKACSAVSLMHVKTMGAQGDEVCTKPLEGTVNAKELAEHLIGRAEGYSQDLSGIQTFKLLAFYGSNEPRSPFYFTTSDGNVMSRSEAGIGVHEPTPTGMLGQLMKHNEALMSRNEALVGMAVSMSNGVMSLFLGGPNGGGILQQSIQHQMEAIGVVKDAMLDMGRERKQMLIEEHKAAQDLQTRKAVIDALPMMVNRFTGREVFNESDVNAKILETLAMKVTPQDLELLVAMGKLSKEEALALGAQFTKIVQEKKKEAELLRLVPSEESQPKSLPPNGSSQNGNGTT